MSNRIKIAFPKDEQPENILPDLNWVGDNRLALYKKYGACVVVVYKQEIIGMGKSHEEALADAEAHLAEDIQLATPIVEYISNPYQIGHFYRKESQE